ncbi:MAG: response regulator [Terriglobales bacterium]
MARKVLLADDSVTAQNMGRRIMTDAGYEVITVNNGSAALKKIHESQPDLIVLDVYMPGYGGLEVCQRLKENEATMKIPVLLTVGKMEPFKVEEAKRVHADGHIIKPFDASELLSALTKLEDKIVPSENGRGRRGKNEAKKARIFPAADPVADFDDSHTDQIKYLAQVKNRRPTEEVPGETQDSPLAQPAADAAPALHELHVEAGVDEAPAVAETSSYESAESARPVAEEEGNQEQSHESVTFAAGPIYEPELATPAAIEKPSEEFEIQREPEIEHELEPAREMSGTPFVVEPLADLERPPISEIAVTETIAAAETEPGLVSEGGWSAPQAEPEPTQRWVAENVAHSSEEGARSLEEEMQQAQGTNAVEPREGSNQEPTRRSEAELETEQPEIDSQQGAAFAAAASASEGFAQTNAVSSGSSDSEPPAGSESSAAWDNWERIRDTVITERAAEAIAESAGVIADAAVSSQNDAPAASSASEPASEQASNHDALSSIVDSVLAELKPRLLAEIAKQLAQDKK